MEATGSTFSSLGAKLAWRARLAADSVKRVFEERARERGVERARRALPRVRVSTPVAPSDIALTAVQEEVLQAWGVETLTLYMPTGSHVPMLEVVTDEFRRDDFLLCSTRIGGPLFVTRQPDGRYELRLADVYLAAPAHAVRELLERVVATAAHSGRFMQSLPLGRD